MTEWTDHQLLAEFAKNGSETAFATLAARYVNLVYSAALRFSGNPHHAQEITQAVFVILAQKAASLSRKVILSGWLYQTARLAAANFVKGEIRRQKREQEAYMQSLNEPDASTWDHISPHLEEAMGALGETDRTAVVLRFFEKRTAAETALILHSTESAVHKRVTRALDKLRKFFLQRGLTLSVGVLASALTAHSVQAAPVGLTAVLTVKSTSATITTLTHSTLKTMTWLKLKTSLGLTAAVLLAGGGATVAVSQLHPAAYGPSSTAQEIARKSIAAYAALKSYQDDGIVVTTGASSSETVFHTRLQRPGQYRIDWTQTAAPVPSSSGTVYSDGKVNYLQSDRIPREKMSDSQMALASATGISSGAAATIPASFFNGSWGGQLHLLESDRTQAKNEGLESVNGTECSVLSYHLDPITLPNGGGKTSTTATKLWIGTKDHLIHRLQTITSGGGARLKLTDDFFEKMLKAQNKPVTPEAIAAARQDMEKQLNTGFTFDETHNHIIVNKKISTADFVPSK